MIDLISVMEPINMTMRLLMAILPSFNTQSTHKQIQRFLVMQSQHQTNKIQQNTTNKNNNKQKIQRTKIKTNQQQKHNIPVVTTKNNESQKFNLAPPPFTNPDELDDDDDDDFAEVADTPTPPLKIKKYHGSYRFQKKYNNAT